MSALVAARFLIRFALQLAFGSLVFASPVLADATTNSAVTLPGYETRTNHDPNGIGKFYLGREIARVMGHEGADWLERDTRETEERPDLLVPALKLQPGDVVADLGCGTGYHTRRLAKAVSTNGLVYAVDI